jgi:hypothetical protein
VVIDDQVVVTGDFYFGDSDFIAQGTGTGFPTGWNYKQEFDGTDFAVTFNATPTTSDAPNYTITLAAGGAGGAAQTGGSYTVATGAGAGGGAAGDITLDSAGGIILDMTSASSFAWAGTALLKLDDSSPAEFTASAAAGTSTYYRAQSGADRADGTGYAGASGLYKAGQGGDATGGVNIGGKGGDWVFEPGLKGAGFGGGAAGADGKVIVRQPGGTPGTDELYIYENGSSAKFDARTGSFAFMLAGTNRYSLDATGFRPLTENARENGGPTTEWRNTYLGEDRQTATACSTSGLYLGLGQEARLRYNKDATGYPASTLILGLEASGTAAKDSLAFSSATITGFTNVTNDTAGEAVYTATQGGGPSTAGNGLAAGTWTVETGAGSAAFATEGGDGGAGGSLAISLGLGGAGDGAGATGAQGTLTVDGPVAINPATTVSALAVYSGQSTAPLGSELVTNGDFASDLSGWTASNWTWNAGTAKHDLTFVDALSQAVAITNGETYQIEFDITGRTAGTITPTLNGVNVPLHAVTNTYTANGTYKRSVVANATGSLLLAFTPSADFDGALDGITLKQITGAATSPSVGYDDSNSIFYEMRGDAGLSTLALGVNAMRLNTTGYYNSALGVSAMYSNTTGYCNSALGVSAMYSNTTGYYNSALGVNAMYSNETGNSNVAVGYESSKGTSVANRSNNVVIGYRAGAAMQAADNNVLVGYKAGDNITTASGAVIIGYDIDAASATGTGDVNIAGLFKGTVGAEVVIGPNNFITTDSAIEAVTGSISNGNGTTFVGMHIKPTYAQGATTAAATDLLVSRWEQSVGSGGQYLMDLGTTTDGTYASHTSLMNVTNGGLLTLLGSVDSAAVADQVSLSRYEIGAGNTVLAISQETAVAVEVDETKVSHKMQCRINGVSYYIVLMAT